MALEIGQVIDGKYRVDKLLGKGGMGSVYAAEHLVIGRRVALKVLHGTVAENENAVVRFEREAQAAGRIGNDHILEVFDFGSLADGSRYMVCEYLEGETLAARLSREGQLSPAALVPIGRQLLNGLGAAHAAGVVHRDLKPENVFVLRQKAGWADFVKIIDFGISKFQQHGGDEAMQMTATGIVVGTPCYLSPEQARGSREADPRSDIYTVGVILYEAVTGKLPFKAQNVNDLLFKIVLEAPRPISEIAPDVDPGFAEIIAMAMARAPENRFQTTAEFSSALESWAVEHGIALSGPSLTSSASGTKASSGAVKASSGVVKASSGAVKASSSASKPSSGATFSLSPTPGTWADSQISPFPIEKPRNTTRIRVAAIVGVMLIAGAAFAVYKATSSPHDSVAAAGASSPAVAPSLAPNPVDKPSAQQEGLGASAVQPTPPPRVESITPHAPAPPADFDAPQPKPLQPVRQATPRPVKNPKPSAPTSAAPHASGQPRQRRDFGY